MPQDAEARPLSGSGPADGLSWQLGTGPRYGYILSLRAFSRQWFGLRSQILTTWRGFATQCLSGVVL